MQKHWWKHKSKTRTLFLYC